MEYGTRDDLLRHLQEVETAAGEIADGLDALDHRVVRIPDDVAGKRFCTALAQAADQSLRVLKVFLAPEDGRDASWSQSRPGTVAELRALLWSAFSLTLEWLVCADGVDPDSALPGEARWIACYAAPGPNEGHVVHVDAIIPTPRGASTIKQILMGKTELGLEHALAVAALCTTLIHQPVGPHFHAGVHP